MASVATIDLNKSDAHRLADALEFDEPLSALPVALNEVPGGGWQVLVYFTAGHERDEAAALRRIAKTLFGKDAPRVSVATLPETDWVAKSLEGLPPVRAGRFFVHGGHDRERRHANDIAIEIEAGQAFGTGHHGTTAGCLAAIDRLVRTRPIDRALDVGTGSGVLAIAIAKSAKATVLASDIDPVAIRVARENIRLNGVAGYVSAVVAGDLTRRCFKASGPYDLIVANILAEPLMALAPQISGCLAPSGDLVLSGLLPEQRARVVAAYRGLGLPLSRSTVRDGWLTLLFRRGSLHRKGEAHGSAHSFVED